MRLGNLSPLVFNNKKNWPALGATFMSQQHRLEESMCFYGRSSGQCDTGKFVLRLLTSR